MEMPSSITPASTPKTPKVKSKGKKFLSLVVVAKTELESLKTSVSDKDLVLTQTIINNLKGQIKTIDDKYSDLSYLKPLPLIKDYYQDGRELISIANNSLDTGLIVIEAVKPYQ